MSKEQKHEEKRDDSHTPKAEDSELQAAQLIARLAEDYCTSFSRNLETFFVEHCHDFADFTGEYSISHSKLFRSYEKLVESNLKLFCEREDISKKALFGLIQDMAEESELCKMLIELIDCTTEFRLFCELMLMKHRELELIHENQVNFLPSETESKTQSEEKS